jgi:hypothetical protein
MGIRKIINSLPLRRKAISSSAYVRIIFGTPAAVISKTFRNSFLNFFFEFFLNFFLNFFLISEYFCEIILDFFHENAQRSGAFGE